MASSDVDWQSTEKTVLERSRHMFNNPFMSDIVLRCEDYSKEFHAHKYVLATSSSVFHAMFYRELAEKNAVVYLSDTNDDSLEEFLRFLYTDECNLTADNAVFVLYLAKKYIVPSLVEKCVQFLETNLAAENVFVVLEQALQFDEEKLEKKCWDMIDMETSEAVVSDAFTDICQSTLMEFLKRESLNVKEVDLFKAVLKWSEAECLKQEKETNGTNKRAAMGNAIYQIRFASMTLDEFAQNVSPSALLTAEEIILFYEKLGGVERKSGMWNMTKREAKEDILLRCRRCDDYVLLYSSSSNYNTLSNELCMSFSKAVKFYGVRLLGEKGKEYDVKLEILSQSIETTCRAQQKFLEVPWFDVMLLQPVKIQANVIAHMKVTMARDPRVTTRFVSMKQVGSEKKKTAETNGITVNFFNLSDITSGRTNVEEFNLINEIIFSEI